MDSLGNSILGQDIIFSRVVRNIIDSLEVQVLGILMSLAYMFW